MPLRAALIPSRSRSASAHLTPWEANWLSAKRSCGRAIHAANPTAPCLPRGLRRESCKVQHALGPDRRDKLASADPRTDRPVGYYRFGAEKSCQIRSSLLPKASFRGHLPNYVPTFRRDI
jgi:hypothetical protein